MRYEGREALIVGLGESGKAAARFLAARGARIAVTDMRTEEQLAEPLAEPLAIAVPVVLLRPLSRRFGRPGAASLAAGAAGGRVWAPAASVAPLRPPGGTELGRPGLAPASSPASPPPLLPARLCVVAACAD